MNNKREMVNHPQHYNAKGKRDLDGTSVYEPVKVIDSWGFAEGFYLGSALKYILRAKYKGHEREDLEKALWYLERFSQDTRDLQPHHKVSLEPLAVAEAWELPGNLFEAIEYIALGNPGGAASKVAEELSVTGIA